MINYRRKFIWLVAMLAPLAFMAFSCPRLAVAQSRFGMEFDKHYGKTSHSGISGASMLKELFVAGGYVVDSSAIISKSIGNYQTIVWFPNDFASPDQEAIDRLSDWVRAAPNRRLIYVGRDYHPNLAYLSEVCEKSSGTNKEVILRRIVDIEMELLNALPGQMNFSNRSSQQDSCAWFDAVHVGKHPASKIQGPLSVNTETSKAKIEYDELFYPKASRIFQSNVNDGVATLLDVDGHPFVFSIQSNSPSGRSEIVIVSNGSFLFNYSLVNHCHRELAGNLVRGCDGNGKVLFLQSGPGGILITELDKRQKMTRRALFESSNAWGWILRPPLKFIVPQLLMWGVFFCFVFFPIFGRCKKAKSGSTNDFGNHIAATGALLRQTGREQDAMNMIKRYNQLTEDKG